MGRYSPEELGGSSKLGPLSARESHISPGRSRLGRCSGLRMCSHVEQWLGFFVCVFAFKTLPKGLLGCWVLVKSCLGSSDTVKFLRSEIRGV